MTNSAAAIATNSPAINTRRTSISEQPSVLTDIYQDDVNLAVWQHTSSDTLINSVKALINKMPHLKTVITVTPEDAYTQISEHLTDLEAKDELCQHISTLVDMFCTLFDLKRAGLRLTLLDRPMCPKFHVDKVPCRLVTTFYGTATEWLPHETLDRSKLGAGCQGLPDESSGLMRAQSDIQKLTPGDVALLKGEGWFGNENAGLVHRSPALSPNEHRLLLTLDFVD
ncbi:DUF1826 domain-containing protein [Thalassomonas viridans]|uniref:DUF1826 domain-containing protein n=1 Tax=Thalassomonas viridans TaxID=137584 RepID=A0AAE9Z2Z4_9GAMM|nr:DUF1826 domain-containing protein [Thalassomonas viridans]WDE05089.1 DUF1826 domain-containing protein [Thalassomonas viridans]